MQTGDQSDQGTIGGVQDATSAITPAWNGSGATTTIVGATGNQDIDGVLIGTRWTSTNLTFSFPTSATQYGTYDLRP